MHSANHWGGPLEIHADQSNEDGQSNSSVEVDRAALLRQQLNETQQKWLLGPPVAKKEKYVDFGCIACKLKVVKWVAWGALIAFVVIGIPIIISKAVPKHKQPVPPQDEYTAALRKALLFFDAQRSGNLPKNYRVKWRGKSGLRDGSDVNANLTGGYYDAGDNIKFHYPMAFSMTLLSWSVIEYNHKYKAIGEYDHIREIIKWGTDYLLKTFNSSANTIHQIHSQVGSARINSTTPDDHYCWQRPEDMTYPRPTQTAHSAPDLGSEVAAALAAASIVFRDKVDYSYKLIKGAKTVYKFAMASDRPYSKGSPVIEPFYNSTTYWDEYIWASTWMFFATGNYTYISAATDSILPDNANTFLQLSNFSRGSYLSVFSWDNKLPGANLLLTRVRIFLNPGYPYEGTLKKYHDTSNLNMCFYVHGLNVFHYTKGGLIQLNHGQPQSLQYAVNAAFLASLYADYMNSNNVPGCDCGMESTTVESLRNFAISQVDYILGNNPMKMSYVVGYGQKFPRHVHHRGASIPNNNVQFSCKGGWKWRDTRVPNPHNITGAMVGGPIRDDSYRDVRPNSSYTEPTLAGNAGLVLALVSLTSSGGMGNDRNTIASSVPLIFGGIPPPSSRKP